MALDDYDDDAGNRAITTGADELVKEFIYMQSDGKLTCMRAFKGNFHPRSDPNLDVPYLKRLR